MLASATPEHEIRARVVTTSDMSDEIRLYHVLLIVIPTAGNTGTL